jgi:hypothetical protein
MWKIFHFKLPSGSFIVIIIVAEVYFFCSGYFFWWGRLLGRLNTSIGSSC